MTTTAQEALTNSPDPVIGGPATERATRRLPRLLPSNGQPTELAEHLRVHGPALYRGGPRLLISTVKLAGLTGRGGAAFPTHRKLTAVTEGKGQPVVVANGAEGEPASDKDKSLLWYSPHLVLDGLQLAGEAVGAGRVHLYVHRHPRLLARLNFALAERAGAGLDRMPVNVVTAPARFLAGEESAVASRVEGGPALPRSGPRRVFERGVKGAPTLVANVETLAHLALIARYGAGWFRAVGTEHEPGSMLTTVRRADGSSAVEEVAIGTPVADLLRLDQQPAQAVLVGGYHGAWLPGEQARALRLLNGDLRPLGAAIGAGVLAALPPDRCGLVESARVVRYLALESAGQCGPCLNGLPRIAAAFTRLAGLASVHSGSVHSGSVHSGSVHSGSVHSRSVHSGSVPADWDDVQRWSRLVERRGACHHPDGTVRFLRSALTVFANEVALHEARRCSAASTVPFLPIPAASPSHEEEWS
jgi:NADH:ubiquinone oxidoreductase subunit F (NADH-binding)